MPQAECEHKIIWYSVGIKL